MGVRNVIVNRFNDVQHRIDTTERTVRNNQKQRAGISTARNAVAYTTRATRRLRDHQQQKKVRGAASYAATRVAVSAANNWILFWALFWYGFVQMPLAITTNIGLGMAAAVYAVLGETVGGAVLSLLEQANRLFSILFDPMELFLVGVMLILFFSGIQLLLSWFTYTMVGVKSLSGQWAAAKIGFFILALFGLFIPILNLLPLIPLWAMIVWLKPR